MAEYEKIKTESAVNSALSVFARTKLFLVAVNSNNLNTLVETALLANSVCKVVLAALRALYKVGGSLTLPNVRTSLHFSRMRSFSLWYCHCCLPPEVSLLKTAFSYMLIFIFFFHLIEYFLKRKKSWINFLRAAATRAVVKVFAAFRTKTEAIVTAKES